MIIKLTQAILIFLFFPLIFRLLAMKRIRNMTKWSTYLPFVCGFRWQWCFSFCSLEPKWTRRTFSFCPLGSLSPSSALHLDTSVWVEVFCLVITVFWIFFAQYCLEDEFLAHCKCWVFLVWKMVIFLLLVWNRNGFNPLSYLSMNRFDGKTRSWALRMQHL